MLSTRPLSSQQPTAADLEARKQAAEAVSPPEEHDRVGAPDESKLATAPMEDL